MPAMPAAITSSRDPIAVFDYAATISPELGEGLPTPISISLMSPPSRFYPRLVR
jgi:hypothetical protein